MKASTKAIRFLETLAIPEGPKAGQKTKLAPFQKKFVKGALADSVQVAVLSIGRGNAKRRYQRASHWARLWASGIPSQDGKS